MEKTSNFVLDEVMEIIEVGEFETYDFVIPKTHCFVANGILTHNSGDLEQNADNVWALWREDRETDEARLEQLKGRDTGTWTIRMRFNRNIQRFYDGGDWTEARFNHDEGEGL